MIALAVAAAIAAAAEAAPADFAGLPPWAQLVASILVGLGTLGMAVLGYIGKKKATTDEGGEWVAARMPERQILSEMRVSINDIKDDVERIRSDQHRVLEIEEHRLRQEDIDREVQRALDGAGRQRDAVRQAGERRTARYNDMKSSGGDDEG